MLIHYFGAYSRSPVSAVALMLRVFTVSSQYHSDARTLPGQSSALQHGAQRSTYVMSFILRYVILYFRSHISKIAQLIFTRSACRKMTNGLQYKLLVSELFLGWEGDSEMSLFQQSPLDIASRNRAWRQNGFSLAHLSKKLPDFGQLISLPNAENARKSLKGRPRSFSSYVPISDSGTLLNRERLSSFLSLGGAAL